MTEKKLDEILFELKGLKPKIDLILEELVAKKPEPKVVGFPVKRETFMKEEIIEPSKTSNFALPKTGKYQWYQLLEDNTIKLRKCTNEGCLLFLKWDDIKKKYEHWKYDANTGVGGFVQDKCDFYGGF